MYSLPISLSLSPWVLKFSTSTSTSLSMCKNIDLIKTKFHPSLHTNESILTKISGSPGSASDFRVYKKKTRKFCNAPSTTVPLLIPPHPHTTHPHGPSSRRIGWIDEAKRFEDEDRSSPALSAEESRGSRCWFRRAPLGASLSYHMLPHNPRKLAKRGAGADELARPGTGRRRLGKICCRDCRVCVILSSPSFDYYYYYYEHFGRLI